MRRITITAFLAAVAVWAPVRPARADAADLGVRPRVDPQEISIDTFFPSFRAMQAD